MHYCNPLIYLMHLAPLPELLLQINNQLQPTQGIQQRLKSLQHKFLLKAATTQAQQNGSIKYSESHFNSVYHHLLDKLFNCPMVNRCCGKWNFQFYRCMHSYTIMSRYFKRSHRVKKWCKVHAQCNAQCIKKFPAILSSPYLQTNDDINDVVFYTHTVIRDSLQYQCPPRHS